eukprot:snap_masked-scaffold212_size255419-processed-gene-1.10 protein:Tk00546 transcript:snap_masked-scaffold212_size255419-processed-gene-1.10-mRNA-1 annotation:"alpha- -mannosyl-glycoprotein 2-beta-n-acetylglucosaminyltransferase"
MRFKEHAWLLAALFMALWMGLTYLLFIQRPAAWSARQQGPGRLEAEFQRRLSDFETRLQSQLGANRELLERVRGLAPGEPAHEPQADPFVDGANEYDRPKHPRFYDIPAGEELSASAARAPPVLPVLMFACNRVTVSRAVDLLLKYRGERTAQFPLIVSQDCGHADTWAVLQGYGDQIIALQQPDQRIIPVPKLEKKFQGYFKIARHYGWALNYTFHALKYEQVIVVEDDLEVAPDFFEYFEATLPILRADPSLFCVSAWNDNGKAGLIDETLGSRLYRSDFFGGLGWMLTRDLWAELSPKWPASYWDDWIRQPAQRRQRACLRPEISRTKTFGKVGVSNGLFYDKHLKFIQLNAEPFDFTRADLSYLKRELYDPAFEAQLNVLPVVSIEEIRSGEAATKHKVRHGAVRLLYHTKNTFQRYAKVLGIMDDFKAGVPRMAYQGVVSTVYQGLRVHVSPAFSWKGYDPTW